MNINMKFREANSERGVSLLELALILPLLLVFITGIIDYGVSIKTIKSLSSAAKTGARYAAAQSAAQSATGVAVKCSAETSLSLDTKNCDQILASSYADSIEYFAKWATCDSLNRADLGGEDWQVKVDVKDGAAAASLTPGIARVLAAEPGSVSLDDYSIPSGKVVKVTAQRDAAAGRFCIICLDLILNKFKAPSLDNSVLQSTSAFALEGICS